jgi:hypothetical protein
MCRLSKSGSLKLLEPFGPVKACNGIALPLAVTVIRQQAESYIQAALMLLDTLKRNPHPIHFWKT